jgi:hypothetical protein
MYLHRFLADRCSDHYIRKPVPLPAASGRLGPGYTPPEKNRQETSTLSFQPSLLFRQQRACCERSRSIVTGQYSSDLQNGGESKPFTAHEGYGVAVFFSEKNSNPIPFNPSDLHTLGHNLACIKRS